MLKGKNLKEEGGKILELNSVSKDFPVGPVTKTPCSQCRGPGLIPIRELDPHATTKSSHAATKEPVCCKKNTVQPNKYKYKKKSMVK